MYVQLLTACHFLSLQLSILHFSVRFFRRTLSIDGWHATCTHISFVIDDTRAIAHFNQKKSSGGMGIRVVGLLG